MRRTVPALLALLACLAACNRPATVAGNPPTSPSPAPSSTSAGDTPAPGAGRVTISKVLTVVLENHGTNAALTAMPYVAGLARSYGRTSHYRALTHPSLPNYLALAGGSTFGVLDDKDPGSHRLTAATVFDTALEHGRAAATYSEGMSGTCEQGSHGTYAVRHNPWVYFSSARSRAACERFDVGTDHLDGDITAGHLPDVGMLVPDLCHDAHDCSLGTADQWVRGWFNKIMSGPDYRSGHLALVVTFDEGEGNGDVGTDVLTVVVAPGLHQKVATAALDHRSWCRWMTDLVGAPPLPGAARALSLGAAFDL